MIFSISKDKNEDMFILIMVENIELMKIINLGKPHIT